MRFADDAPQAGPRAQLVAVRSVQSSPFPVPQQEADKLAGAARCHFAWLLDTHNIVVALIQCRRVRHGSIHDPALSVVLCPDEVFNLPIIHMLSVSRPLMSHERNSLTPPRERGRAPASPPNICMTLAHARHDKWLATNLLALALPHFSTLWSCSSVQASKSTDLTRLMCVPIPRWMPEHRMQMKIPKFHEAHRGSR